jgi:hypothetical protein
VRTTSRSAFALVVVMLGLSAGLAGCRPAPPVTDPPGSITIKYGPYKVPKATTTTMGMIENAFAFGVQKACSNCFITNMQAGLTTEDGANANVSQGLWLHHMVLFDSSKQDVTCTNSSGAPIGVGALGQRFFSSGNERTPTKFGGSYGYRQGAADKWNLIYDLMNMTAQERSVYVTVKFDYVPDTTPGYKDITPMWLDINQCGTSERPAKTGQYSYDYSTAMKGNGKLLGIAGHLHDGGTHITIDQNGQLVCDSVATYGGSPDYIETASSIHMPGMAHISSMSRCQGTAEQPVATVRTGDTIKLTAYYDSNAHMQMGTDPVMGIAIGFFDMS